MLSSRPICFLDFRLSLFSPQDSTDFVSVHAYVGKSKENVSRQFIRPNPSHLRFDFSAGFRDGLKRMLQVGARSIKGPNAYQ
jgi:hypothetical protein